MKLIDLLYLTAQRAIENQDTYIAPGKNGPYGDAETRVRSISHWIVLFSRLYSITKEKKYYSQIDMLIRELGSESFRPHGYTFLHREKKGKDKCNGLIGQAWVIEALCEAGTALQHERCLEMAEGLFFIHPFDEEVGLWRRVEVDGQILPYDVTFNHQLWFAGCASMIDGANKDEVLRKVSRFMDCVDINMTLLETGAIYHPILNLINKHEKYSLLSFMRKIKKSIQSNLPWDEIAKNKIIFKSIGYHAFNLYAFCFLKDRFPGHSFWLTEKFEKMILFALSDEFRGSLEGNTFGYPYNPVGFEIPFALSQLTPLPEREKLELSEWWVNQQISRHYNHNSGRMDLNLEDPYTSTSRIYEISRLPEKMLMEITISGK